MTLVTGIWLLCLWLISLLGMTPKNIGNTGALAFRIGTQLVQTLIILLLMWKMDILSPADFTLKGKAKGFLLGWVAIVIPAGNMVLNFMGIDFVAPDPLHLIVAFLQPFIGTGLIEEVLFRGLMLLVLLKAAEQSKKGIMNAVIVSSVIFGLAHFLNLLEADIIRVGTQVVFATGMGVFFSAIYLRTKTLWIPIILHGFFNLSSRIQAPFAYVSSYVGDYIGYTPQESMSSVDILIMRIPLLVIGVVHLIAGLILLRKVNPDETVESESR